MHMNGNLEIVSNNPRMTANFAAIHGIVHVNEVTGSPLEVLARAEELLQDGYCLVSAPLPPNIPLMRAPYRSLIIEKAPRKYDTAGLTALFKAQTCMSTQRAIESDPVPGTEADFALIDEELLLRTLRDYELGCALDLGFEL